LALVRSSWGRARRFQWLLEEDPRRFRTDDAGSWLVPSPLGRVPLPGLAAIHAVVLTADRKVLFTRRPRNASFYPNHWSASFEEQLTARDFECPDAPAPVAAACRGLSEELGMTIEPSRCRVLSGLLEIGILNAGFMILIETSGDSQAIRTAWQTRTDAEAETKEIEFIEAEPQALRQAIEERVFGPWHPSSELRLEFLARWMKQRPPTSPNAVLA
jgi:hypothetical protein